MQNHSDNRDPAKLAPPLPIEFIRQLSSLPHRYSTSPEEQQAADIIKKTFESAGLKPELQPFKSYKTFGWIYALLYGAYALAAFLGAIGFTYYALPIYALAVFFFIGESTTRWPWVGRILPHGASQNVIAEIPSIEPSDAEIVLTAHYDTSKTGTAFSPKMAKHLRLTFLGSLLLMACAGVSLGLQMVYGETWVLRALLIAAGGYFLYGVVLMFEREIRGRYVNGANDNGSGTAILLALSHELAARPLTHYNIICVATGCEEVGMEGMKVFFRERGAKNNQSKTLFFNFDNVGAGNLHYITGEGILLYHRAGSQWLSAAKKVTEQTPFSVITGRDYRALTLDSLIPASRGYSCMSLMALDEYGVAPNWHWDSDTIDQVDPHTVELAFRFAVEVLRTLDSDKLRLQILLLRV